LIFSSTLPFDELLRCLFSFRQLTRFRYFDFSAFDRRFRHFLRCHFHSPDISSPPAFAPEAVISPPRRRLSLMPPLFAVSHQLLFPLSPRHHATVTVLIISLAASPPPLLMLLMMPIFCAGCQRCYDATPLLSPLSPLPASAAAAV